jgi:hypothetical protein
MELICRVRICCPLLYVLHLRITKDLSYFDRWFKKLLCGIVSMNNYVDVSTTISLLTFGVKN